MMYDSLIEKFQTPHRLHPATIIFSFAKMIKESILGLGIGLIFTLRESMFYFVLFISLFLIVSIVYSLLSWLRFTYYVEGDELRIEQGVFIRKKRYISKNRIHKIDLTANVVHRLFKLVHVQIDTASGSGDAEVNLSAIRVSDANKLRTLLQKRNNQEEMDSTPIEQEVITKNISWQRLFIAGSTSGSAGVIIIAIFTIFSQIEELIPNNLYDTAYEWFVSLSVVLLIVVILFALFILWVFGIAGTMIRYGNFTIEKREKGLFIKRGLLETKELTIPYQRIQAIGIDQSPIRQPFGFVRIFAVVAGGSFDEQETFPVLFPIMHEKEVAQFITTFLPEYKENVNRELIRAPKKSRLFYLSKSVIIPLLVLVPVLIFIPKFSWIPLVLLGLNVLLGWYQHKDLGVDINDHFFNFQLRRLQKVYVMTSKNRIQAFEKSQHKIEMLFNVASIRISLLGLSGLGMHYTLKHLDDEVVNEIGLWYSYRKQNEHDFSQQLHIE